MYPYKNNFILLTCSLFLLLSADCFAQTVTDGSGAAAKNRKTTVKIGLGYNSGLNYFGRTDSLKSSGAFPSLEVDFKNGLYLSSDFIFLHNNVTDLKYAATNIEGGFKFNNTANTFTGNVFVSKFFYNSSELVQSALKAQTGVNLSFLNKIIDVNGGADMKFSDKADIGLTGGIDHIIKFTGILGKGVLVLDPSAYVYGGTQNFTHTYYKQENLLFLPVSEQQVSEQGKRFDILAYEFSVPVVLAVSKFQVILDPAYILPQHVINPDGTERQNPPGLFYITAGVNYTF